jgi:CrcB protein
MNADQPSPPIALPVHLNWRYLALVAAGGIVGTALRELLTNAVPRIGYVPVSILGINLLGAFLLGGLVETLVRRGPDYGWRRALRLLLGTGVLGGFTTYSALATDTVLLLARADIGAALLYSLGTLTLGALASWAGISAAAAGHRWRPARLHDPDPDSDSDNE